jgi:MHS family proline/betaine transporter-like MFS transporter
MIAGLTAYTYIGNIFLTTFASTALHLRIADAQLGVIVFNLIGAACMPFAGLLSDRFGRRAVIIPAVVAFSIVYLGLAARLVADPSNSALWSLQASALIFVFVSGPFAALALETFPVGVRSTGASIVYNFGVAIFGGLSPLITGSLVAYTGSNFAPFYYLGACLVLSLVGLLILPKRDASILD